MLEEGGDEGGGEELVRVEGFDASIREFGAGLGVGPAVGVVAQGQAEDGGHQADAEAAGDGVRVVGFGAAPLSGGREGALEFGAHGEESCAAAGGVAVPGLAEVDAAADVEPAGLEAEDEAEGGSGAAGGFAAGGGGDGDVAAELFIHGFRPWLRRGFRGGGRGRGGASR